MQFFLRNEWRRQGKELIIFLQGGQRRAGDAGYVRLSSRFASLVNLKIGWSISDATLHQEKDKLLWFSVGIGKTWQTPAVLLIFSLLIIYYQYFWWAGKIKNKWIFYSMASEWIKFINL